MTAPGDRYVVGRFWDAYAVWDLAYVRPSQHVGSYPTRGEADLAAARLNRARQHAAQPSPEQLTIPEDAA